MTAYKTHDWCPRCRKFRRVKRFEKGARRCEDCMPKITERDIETALAEFPKLAEARA